MSLQADNLEPQRFSVEETQKLLEQLLANRSEAKLDVEVRELASAIQSCAGGHRGLTGVCLAQVRSHVSYVPLVSLPVVCLPLMSRLAHQPPFNPPSSL